MIKPANLLGLLSTKVINMQGVQINSSKFYKIYFKETILYIDESRGEFDSTFFTYNGDKK